MGQFDDMERDNVPEAPEPVPKRKQPGLTRIISEYRWSGNAAVLSKTDWNGYQVKTLKTQYFRDLEEAKEAYTSVLPPGAKTADKAF